MVHGSNARDDQRDRFEISLSNQQSVHAVDEKQLLAAARLVLEDSDFNSAAISLAVVDDATIHALNRQFLHHDYATDVLSFVLDERDGHLEGEVIFSADTAAAASAEADWSAAAEQMLYVVHGMLHLVGHRDKSPDDAQEMRAAELKYLRQFGFDLPSELAAEAGSREIGAP